MLVPGQTEPGVQHHEMSALSRTDQVHSLTRLEPRARKPVIHTLPQLPLYPCGRGRGGGGWEVTEVTMSKKTGPSPTCMVTMQMMLEQK